MCAVHPPTHHHNHHPCSPHLCLCTADKDLRAAQQCRRQNGKSTFQPLSVSGCGPRCIPPVTANPMGLSQSISTKPRSSGALPLQFSLTGQHANPLTQGRLDGVEGVTRPEVNGTNLGRGPLWLAGRWSDCITDGFWKFWEAKCSSSEGSTYMGRFW